MHLLRNLAYSHALALGHQGYRHPAGARGLISYGYFWDGGRRIALTLWPRWFVKNHAVEPCAVSRHDG